MNYQTVKLEGGSHESPAKGACVMEVVSLLAREPFTDHPQCVCPALRGFLIRLNDWMTDDERQVLWPFTTRVIGTASDGRMQERAFRFADFAVREMAPMALEARGYEAQAAKLRALAPVTDKRTAEEARKAAAHAAAYDAAAAAAAADAAAAATAHAAATATAAHAAAAAAAYADVDDRKTIIEKSLALLDELCPSGEPDLDALAWDALEEVREAVPA